MPAMNRVVQVRRCHICAKVAEAEDDRVHFCPKCSKPFAPFFFTEDRFLPGSESAIAMAQFVEFISQDQSVRQDDSMGLKSTSPIGPRRSIVGVTAWWPDPHLDAPLEGGSPVKT